MSHRLLPLFVLTAALVGLVSAPPALVDATIANGAADHVWGQQDLSSAGCHLSATGRSTLCAPTRSAVDGQGNLWVADWWNNRVLMYPYVTSLRRPSRDASTVLGQYGDLTERLCNGPAATSGEGVPNAYTLCNPNGIAIDRHDTLYVSDQGNNRVLVYLKIADKIRRGRAIAADAVLGQSDFASGAANVTASSALASGCGSPSPASACTLNSPEGVSLDSHGDLLVADTLNNRVLQWSEASLAGIRRRICLGACPIAARRVWGQNGSFTSSCPNLATSIGGCSAYPTTPVPPGAATLNGPEDAVVDGKGNLIIADTGNNRVLEYDNALRSGRQDATSVYGQDGSFVTGFANLGSVAASPASLSGPTGLALDSSHQLWVADEGNNRVLAFPSSNDMSAVSDLATRVLGQHGSFTSSQPGSGADGLDHPYGVTFDASDSLYIADHGSNDRVVEYAGLF